MRSESQPYRLSPRREIDAETLHRVSRADFKGPIFDTFISELYRYAWPVMLKAIRTGSISDIKTQVPHRPITADDLQLLHDSAPEREDLAMAAIERAIPQFVVTLKAGKWDPSRGRSLRSYFITACTYAFWREYARWSDARRQNLIAITRLAGSNQQISEDFELHHEYCEVIDLLLNRAGKKSPELEAILRCFLSGLTASEIADNLRYSARAIEGRLYQFRKTAWRLVREGRIDPALVPGSRARLARELAR